MKISSIPSYMAPAYFGARQKNVFTNNPEDKIELNTEKQKKKEPFLKKFKTAIVSVFSSAATAATLIFIFSKKLKSVANKHNELCSDLETSNKELKKSNADLLASNENLKKANEELQKGNDKLTKKINSIVLPENYWKDVDAKIVEISKKQLPYSPLTPQRTEKKHSLLYRENNNPITILPSRPETTTNRNDAKELKYPTFKEGTSFQFEFPSSREIKLTKEHINIQSQPEAITTISESYSDSLIWDNNKIARDLLQNFYDGHGQTLDGVKIDMTPTEQGKYTVKISGMSTFTPDKAILLGETTKKNNEKSAGNYGEGLKMVVLKLLREKGADNVKVASDNWEVNYCFKDSGFGKNVLAYKLDKVEPFNGNYIEFNTDNTELLRSIIDSFDRFYHYNNPAFKCPNFENSKLSVQLTPTSEKGKFFIAGQAFEVNGNYEGLKGMNINIKNKPPLSYNNKTIFDPSRDRVSLTADSLKALGNWVISKENMSKDDAIKLIHTFERYWDFDMQKKLMTTFNEDKRLESAFISGLFEGAGDRGDLNIKFPNDKYVADGAIYISQELKNMYKQAGYIICDHNLANCGMRSIEDLINESRKHKPLEPTQSEKNRILILQEAIQLMAPILSRNNFFTENELQSKIYILDKDSEQEDKSYRHIKGEAIIKDGESYGFWLDKEYLNKGDFASVLATSLHELTHKFGGDESTDFSYKLTEVLQKVFAGIEDNPNLAIKLKVLEEVWNAQSKK